MNHTWRVMVRERGQTTWRWMADFRLRRDCNRFVKWLSREFNEVTVVKDEVI